MTPAPHPPEDYWASILFILSVATILIANAMLLHGSSHRKGGRFVRPLLRHAVRSRERVRSRSSSISNIGQLLLMAEQSDNNQGSARAGREEDNGWREAAERWVLWDPNETTRAVVQGWIDVEDSVSARKFLMGKRLAFGTSGLRGAMGPGFGRMNDLVIIQTTQGLCKYLEERGGEEFKRRGVVIGRDHRSQDGVSSQGFARLAAGVLVSRGFRVYLMSGTVATPLVAYGVLHLKACAGVMVTASHNPKEDNGYKVYWGNGSQIIPPHDTAIAASIDRNLAPWQTYDPASAIAGPLCSDPVEAVADAYYRGISEQLCRRPDANARSDVEVVYSAMHGVGDAWARRAFECFSLRPFISVASQQKPDPEFPTVKFPNPEEPGALKEAIILAEDRGVPYVLANDPDGDRLAAAERQPSGEWHVFSGNEIGVLLGLWQWEEWRRTNPDKDPSEAVMIASTVSSKMLSAVARHEGFTFEETLPGFKWMGHRSHQLKAQGKTVLFAYEEAIGFGPGDVVFEKDGLSSAALFTEMIVALHNREVALNPFDYARDTTGKGATDAQDSGCATTAPPSPVMSPPSPLRTALAVPAIAATGGFDEVWTKRHCYASTLKRRLGSLHERYGEFAEENGYVRCEDKEIVGKIFSRLRGDGKYCASFGPYDVTAVRDLAEGHGFDSETSDGKPNLPSVGGGAHFVTFKLGHEGVVATLRTSGTEPKIKFYLEMQGKPGEPLAEVSARLSQVAEVFVNEALEPKRWGMKRVAVA